MVPSQWEEAANSISNSNHHRAPITLICGPKNSGKSTFSRHLLNNLLSQRYEAVAYLDTDVGQPEFSPPGCLSLHLVHESLSDTVNQQIKTPERCFFFGDISSKRDPKAYLNYIFSLYDYFLEEYHQPQYGGPGKRMLPLIINTPGWVRGTGFDVLVEVLRHIAPTYVVQIRISAESKNLPTGAFWLDVNEEAANLIEIHSARRDSLDQSILMQKDARRSRDHRLLNYFKQCFPSYINIETNKELAHALGSLPPYEVSISRIKVMHLHCEVPESEIFHSLNATIVGLAVSSAGISMAQCRSPWCVGLGIVRGVDLRKDVLYVITPIPFCNLKKIDLLLQGFIEIPTAFLQVRDCVSPYMSTNVLHKLVGKET
ncbi:polynucleotide 5'-hydroxyl-kinase NOL9 [Iris pallida]|uniref:Polynucleotide 5'-hydroxyl-kinase NOL9 n=1 Tax=Iris pallida TaxID=29817 RepID=A0AAX6HTG2_IRIPA|nr:polynucleotide 5'-hydroxyl-kinase NOL9 [Iris pallida]